MSFSNLSYSFPIFFSRNLSISLSHCLSLSFVFSSFSSFLTTNKQMKLGCVEYTHRLFIEQRSIGSALHLLLLQLGLLYLINYLIPFFSFPHFEVVQFLCMRIHLLVLSFSKSFLFFALFSFCFLFFFVVFHFFFKKKDLNKLKIKIKYQLHFLLFCIYFLHFFSSFFCFSSAVAVCRCVGVCQSCLYMIFVYIPFCNAEFIQPSPEREKKREKKRKSKLVGYIKSTDRAMRGERFDVRVPDKPKIPIFLSRLNVQTSLFVCVCVAGMPTIFYFSICR